MVISPQITMTPAIITAMPGAGRGSPSRIAASIARHRRRARAAVTTPARISRTQPSPTPNGASAPPGAGRLRRRRRRVRAPSAATQDTSVHSLVGTALQDYAVRSCPHPRCRDAESLVRTGRGGDTAGPRGAPGGPGRTANRLSNRAVKDASGSDRHAGTSRVSSRREIVAWAKVWRAEKPWR